MLRGAKHQHRGHCGAAITAVIESTSRIIQPIGPRLSGARSPNKEDWGVFGPVWLIRVYLGLVGSLPLLAWAP